MIREELDIKIKETKEILKNLQNESVKLDIENLIKGLEEGEYYKINNIGADSTLFFKYTPQNFQVRDGTGTIGYNGTNYVYIYKGIIRTIHRFSGDIRIFDAETFPIDVFNNPFGGKIEKSSKEEIDELKNEIKDDLDRI